MRTRLLRGSDIPALQQMAKVSGYPYPDLMEPMEAVLVVADQNDKPVMAVAVEKLIQAYLWCGQGLTPHEKIAAIRQLHEAMVPLLKAKGYNQIEAYLPPNVSEKFGKRLEKTFQWVRNWPSWNWRFSNGER